MIPISDGLYARCMAQLSLQLEERTQRKGSMYIYLLYFFLVLCIFFSPDLCLLSLALSDTCV